MIRLLLIVTTCASATLVGARATATPPPRANVILMMADDLGYRGLSCYGSEDIRTPRLDRLAAQGVKLTSFYAGATVCSPSRMALLSGAYPSRVGWDRGVVGYGMKKGAGLSTDVYTIAEAFRDAGYRTAISGKWHVGDGKLRPMHHGFDATYYIIASNNMGRDIYRGDRLVHKNYDNRRLTETFTEEVIRVIDEDADKPFFIYVPFTAPHFPAEAHPEWDGRSKRDAFCDVVEELDACVGRILDALEKKGIADNTIVVFLSDNGPQGKQSKYSVADPYSGTKWSSREGGTRVPCIVRWPGVVRPGRTSDALVSAIDLYPTLARACGFEPDTPANAQRLDGIDVSNTLTGGDEDAPGRPELLYWHGWGEATAIRKGKFKLYFAAGKKHSADPDVSDGPALFDLDADPAEATDVSAEHPQVVERLHELARQKLADIEQHRVPLGTVE